jgi:cytoskeleton protein RodZ
MTTALPEQRAEDAAPSRSPGQYLREARHASRMSKDEVSARLHLDPRVVDALEGDRYDRLPEPSFVRGYLRAYARLLDMPAERVIEAYDRLGFGPPRLVADISVKDQPGGGLSARVLALALLAVMLGLAAAWWQNRGPVPGVEQLFLPRTDHDAAESAPADTAPREPRQARDRAPPTEPDAESSPAADLSTSAPPPPAEEPDEPVVNPVAATPPSVLATTPPGVEAAAPLAPAEAAPPAPVGDRLVIRLRNASWVEAYDADRQKLYVNNAKAGETLSLTGKGPMRVLLGYARDAEVEYNGAAFDHRPFTNRDIARFTVGTEGARRP